MSVKLPKYFVLPNVPLLCYQFYENIFVPLNGCFSVIFVVHGCKIELKIVML